MSSFEGRRVLDRVEQRGQESCAGRWAHREQANAGDPLEASKPRRRRIAALTAMGGYVRFSADSSRLTA